MKTNNWYDPETREYVSWEELQKRREERTGIRRGDVLELRLDAPATEIEARRRYTVKKARVVALFRHHASLELQGGGRLSLPYLKLKQCIV